MRAECVLFFGHFERDQSLVHGGSERSKLWACCYTNPKDAGERWRRKESKVPETDLERLELNRLECSLNFFGGIVRFFSNEFQGNVERLRSNPARLRRKAGYPLHKALDASADRLGNVKGDEQAHGFY